MQQQSTPGVLSPPQRRMFYGWWIVIIGCLQDAVKGGLFNTGFSLYFLPVLNELHLSHSSNVAAVLPGETRICPDWSDCRVSH